MFTLTKVSNMTCFNLPALIIFSTIQKHKDKVRNYQKKYALTHKDSILESQKKWVAKNKDKVRLNRQKSYYRDRKRLQDKKARHQQALAIITRRIRLD